MARTLQLDLIDPQDKVVEPREVTVGQITQQGITVKTGIQQGEQIVSAGLSRLRSGMTVKPLERERGL